jgi:deoxycytidylate deaminase
MKEGSCGCIHGEANALVKVRSRESGLILFTTNSPCPHCAGLIINSHRIGAVIYKTPYRLQDGVARLRAADIIVAEW